MLHGRQAELSVVAELLEGRSGALVVRGVAGIGKSALLESSAASAHARVLRATGVESEADLPFAALHLLLRPVLEHVEALPPQQADALRGALGLGGTTRGDRFLGGLATLGLLVELSAAGPVLCLVDDAQWLDGESADALLFAARRLDAEPVSVLFAAREGAFPARGLPELRLGELDAEAAHKLLAEQVADLPPAVRDQLVAEARGNPLALIELPRMLTPEQRRGALVPLSFSLGTAQPVTDRVLTGFRDRISDLPDATRACLLVAALDDHDELDVLARALGRLGASLGDFAEAERAGLVRVGPGGVTFHHPLVRTAVLLACDIAARMATHRALAEAVDDDRRAWHLAAVTLQPDEEVAGRLESLALRARLRGGQMAVSAAYARAAELSADPGHAVRRWTAAASAAAEAGLWQRAAELVDKARHRTEAAPAGAVMADLAHVRAMLEVEAGRPLQGVRLLHEGAEAAEDQPTRLSLLSLACYYTWASVNHPDQLALARRTEELCPDGAEPAVMLRTFTRAFRLVLEGDAAVTTLTYRMPDDAERIPFELRVLLAHQCVVSADLRRYTEWAEATGRSRPLAVLYRVRALLAPDGEAGDLYERAMALHAEGRQPFDEARTRLVYGEWMRRHRRRAEARTQLQAAMEAFARLGAVPWADRATAELRATGLSLPDRSRTGDPLAVLTPQELQVVRLAVTGASNREIGAQLFLSPRTVASHLYKAFPKLGVSSRAELIRLPGVA
jgi:DNA-binding CsgD family transcriptional regulator